MPCILHLQALPQNAEIRKSRLRRRGATAFYLPLSARRLLLPASCARLTKDHSRRLLLPCRLFSARRRRRALAQSIPLPSFGGKAGAARPFVVVLRHGVARRRRQSGAHLFHAHRADHKRRARQERRSRSPRRRALSAPVRRAGESCAACRIHRLCLGMFTLPALRQARFRTCARGGVHGRAVFRGIIPAIRPFNRAYPACVRCARRRGLFRAR